MRFEGAIKSWNDTRGFGFIEPTQGGDEVFVHASAFRVRAGRPQLNQRVTFEVELNRDGKKRARNVELVRAAPTARVRGRRQGPAQWGTASLFAIPAFLLVYAVASVLWRVPVWFAALYVVASLVCFCTYAVDKSAAMSGRWRTAESTLLMLGLIGGWPGALVAQQVFRHKSNKGSFQAAFWATVILNVIAFVAIASPMGRKLLGS